MTGTWRWLEANAAERAELGEPAAVLQHEWQPAAAPNRLRHVRRLHLAGETCYLKVFDRTQWKNRLRFALTRPRAASDAEREAAVTQALRRAGIETPRPIAVGGDGRASFYLCARLQGEPLAHLLARGAVDEAMARAVAMFSGDVLARGFRLPDLSLDHLFVRRELAIYHFGLLDLHNAGLAAPGRPPLAHCRKVLRRLQRSVRLLPVPRRQAMVFAVRLLRAAGWREATRSVLRALPPFDTAGRYEVAGRSRSYATRNPARHARELALLARVWPGRPGETVLDAPCGTGRLLPFLRQRGARVVWADAALAMLRQARAAGDAEAVQADALALPFADRAVDGVVLFRFLHHLPPEQARQALAEACRVARRFVVVSHFHPCSAHAVRRALRGWLTGRAPTRHAVTGARLRTWLGGHGFAPDGTAADLPGLKDLWVRAFVRA